MRDLDLRRNEAHPTTGNRGQAGMLGEVSEPAPLRARPAPRPTAPATIEVTAVVGAFRRRWPLAIFGGLALAVVAAVVTWFVMPPAKYKATAILQIAAGGAADHLRDVAESRSASTFATSSKPRRSS